MMDLKMTSSSELEKAQGLPDSIKKEFKKTAQERITELLIGTGRENMDKLIQHMESAGFFNAPCSGSYHLAYPGGLADHSLNVCELALKLMDTLCDEETQVDRNSVIIASLLHDLGKEGQFGKPEYVPNMVKGRATKTVPNPEPKQSDKKPFKVNPELLKVEHEIRGIQIASQYIELTEEESYAILNHNGMYSVLKYTYSGRETPLNLIIHWADMWAARVVELTEGIEEE